MSLGAVVWVTGRPASGKSTLAARIASALRARGACAVILDGDAVRAALSPAPGYGPKARERFYATLGALAALVARQGPVVLVPATANLRRYRDAARALAPRFIEIFVDVDPRTCAERDPKGLYALARRGGAKSLPGAGAPYEEPESPDVVARGGRDRRAITEAVRAISGSAGGRGPRRKRGAVSDGPARRPLRGHRRAPMFRPPHWPRSSVG